MKNTALPAPILQWLAKSGWKPFFGPRDLSRGKGYASEPPISNLEVSSDGEDGILITALVQGSSQRPYRVQVDIFSEHQSIVCYSNCTCPVETECKHGAAVLHFLSKNLPAPSQGGKAPSARLSNDVANWLRLLGMEHKSAARKRTPSKRDFIAYCIEPPPPYGHSDTPVLVLHKASESPKTGLSISDTRPRITLSSPPAYFAEDDIPLAAIYQALCRDYYSDPHLRGRGWKPILEGALKAGRLFYGDGEHVPRVLLAPGPPIAAEPMWREEPTGDLIPMIAFGGDIDSGLVLLPVEPPHYVDPASGLIGPVETRHSAVVLERWSDGPVLKADEVALVEDSAAPLVSSGLPTPRSRETETLSATAPVPHLHIIESSIRSRFNPYQTILGELRFSYHHSPPFAPLTNSQHPSASWIHEGKRYVITRDLKAERKLERKLVTLGLQPLHQIFLAHEYEPSQAHHVAVEHPFPTVASAWLAFIEVHAERLRAEGWQITVDPSSGLVIHEATDFISSIEPETDHGIDWFRFDLSGEVDGKRVSLLPFIAEAIHGGILDTDESELPAQLIFAAGNPKDGQIRFPTKRFLEICRNISHLFQGNPDGPPRLDRLTAAGIAHELDIDGSSTTRALADFGRKLADVRGLPAAKPPASLKAELRPYQLDGYRWLRFLAKNGLHGILADDMGLGKTVQTLAFLAACKPPKAKHKPSLVIAPTSVITNWAAEAARFTPRLRTLLLHGPDRKDHHDSIPAADLVLTSYPLLVRDHVDLTERDWHAVVLDEAQYIKNPRTAVAKHACSLRADHRLCLSGTPLENHLGELWSLMRFLMPGFLGDSDTFRETYRRPIERDRSPQAQLALNRRVAPLILRRTKDQVATDLPPKTEVIHHLDLGPREADLYESVRALMDKRVRDAISERGLGKSHIIVLDALLKLRQICCHPSLLKTPAAEKVKDATKLGFLTKDLLPTLVEDGRRILLFSQFTSMLALIEAHLEKEKIPFLKLTGQTKDRAALVKRFQSGEVPVFLISLKAGGTGLNLTAADTVIHYDPWWNPAAENQATDRAHRIGQDKPVFVHKLICRGSIEDRILELQAHKSRLVASLLSEGTSALRIDKETLSHLLAPIT